MRRIWQAVIALSALTPLLWAEGKLERGFQWTPVTVKASAFSGDLGLLDAERDEYATNLADCAALAITNTKATQESLDHARRLLALALNLSPRNRRAIIVNYQLTKSILPAAAKGDFSPPTMARLLLARSQILANSDNPEDRMLARMFCQVAADIDPKNEDAVYASEVDKLDHGNLDWTFLTRPLTAPAPATNPAVPATSPAARTPVNPTRPGPARLP